MAAAAFEITEAARADPSALRQGLLCQTRTATLLA
jgi:hypothetical protein